MQSDGVGLGLSCHDILIATNMEAEAFLGMGRGGAVGRGWFWILMPFDSDRYRVRYRGTIYPSSSAARDGSGRDSPRTISAATPFFSSENFAENSKMLRDSDRCRVRYSETIHPSSSEAIDGSP